MDHSHSIFKHILIIDIMIYLQARIDMIAAACEGAEKVLADTRKAYCFGTRQGPAIAPTLDKGQAAKIQEQENLLRAAVNAGEGNFRLLICTKFINTGCPHAFILFFLIKNISCSIAKE